MTKRWIMGLGFVAAAATLTACGQNEETTLQQPLLGRRLRRLRMEILPGKSHFAGGAVIPGMRLQKRQ